MDIDASNKSFWQSEEGPDDKQTLRLATQRYLRLPRWSTVAASIGALVATAQLMSCDKPEPADPVTEYTHTLSGTTIPQNTLVIVEQEDGQAITSRAINGEYELSWKSPQPTTKPTIRANRINLKEQTFTDITIGESYTLNIQLDTLFKISLLQGTMTTRDNNGNTIPADNARFVIQIQDVDTYKPLAFDTVYTNAQGKYEAQIIHPYTNFHQSNEAKSIHFYSIITSSKHMQAPFFLNEKFEAQIGGPRGEEYQKTYPNTNFHLRRLTQLPELLIGGTIQYNESGAPPAVGETVETTIKQGQRTTKKTFVTDQNGSFLFDEYNPGIDTALFLAINAENPGGNRVEMQDAKVLHHLLGSNNVKDTTYQLDITRPGDYTNIFYVERAQ